MTGEENTFVPAHAAPAQDAPRTPDASFVPAHAAPSQPEAPEPAEVPLHAEEAAAEPLGAHAAPAEPVEAEARMDAAEPIAAAEMSDDGEDALFAAMAPEAPAPADAEPAADEAQEVEAAPEGTHSPATTAEIDVDAIEAKLSDPGSTQSFEALPEERIDTDSTYDAGTTTMLMWGARSDVGCVREHNEDSYLVQSPLFCVCDGMGGHAAGEVASSIAVETIAKLGPKSADPALLARAVEAANAAVIEAAANGLGKPGMGCTATCAYIEGDKIAIAHVGDSRAYLVHEGTLIRVTRDHSYVEELVDAGEITADEARVHPNRSVITRALGSDPAMYADHFQLNIEEGDRLILCSDGLSSMIPDSEIETIAQQSSTAQICTDNLVDAALAAGGGDNVTVVVVDLVDDGRMRETVRRHKRNILIAAATLVAALVIAIAAGVISINNSFYLGVHNDCVAIYTGIPESVLGIDLHWVRDETTISLDDLPEDTQNRLRAGIPQQSLDSARDTVTQYRRQIDAEQTQQVENAEAIRNSTQEAEAAGVASDPATDADAPAADPATTGGTLADTVAPTEGGDAS